NIGGNSEHTNLQVVETLCAIMNELRPDGAPHKKHIQFVKDRPGHDRRYAIDASKIKRELRFDTNSNFRQKLGEPMAWFLNQRYPD
ncbi:MAG: dTDP-glucose 4,6-dehydratase, partial [Gammaproteobacteria bacterium]